MKPLLRFLVVVGILLLLCTISSFTSQAIVLMTVVLLGVWGVIKAEERNRR